MLFWAKNNQPLTYPLNSQMATTHFGGGGLVRAQTTVRQTPFPWQPCPGRQPPAGSEIPLERIVTVGLMPFHLLGLGCRVADRSIFTDNVPRKWKALIGTRSSSFCFKSHCLCTAYSFPKKQGQFWNTTSPSRKTDINLITWPMKLNMGPKS